MILGQIGPRYCILIDQLKVCLEIFTEPAVLFKGILRRLTISLIQNNRCIDGLSSRFFCLCQILGDNLIALSHLIAAFENQRDRLAVRSIFAIVPNLGGFDDNLFHSMLVFERRNTCGALVGGDVRASVFAGFNCQGTRGVQRVSGRDRNFLPEVLLLLALNILIHAQNHRGPVVVGVERDGVNGGIAGSIGLQACHLCQGASRLAFRRLVAAIQVDRDDGLPHAVLVVVVVPDLQHGEAEVLVIVLILDDCGARRGCGINALDRVASLYQISLVFLPGVGLLFAVDIGGQIAHNRRQRGSQIESGILITVLRACNLCLFAIFFFSERYCDTSIDIVRKQLHDDRSRALTVVVVVVDPFLLDRC